MKFDCCSSFHSVFAVVMAATSQVGVLMKLDKNQRKPRAFKASDLCPYYNRRVNSSHNSGCFHIRSSSILHNLINTRFYRYFTMDIICKMEKFIHLFSINLFDPSGTFLFCNYSAFYQYFPKSKGISGWDAVKQAESDG